MDKYIIALFAFLFLTAIGFYYINKSSADNKGVIQYTSPIGPTQEEPYIMYSSLKEISDSQKDILTKPTGDINVLPR